MNYTYRDDTEKLKQAKADAKQLQIFHDWISANPQFDYQAARNMIQNYYNGEDWTFENLSDSADRLVAQGVIQRLDPPTDDDILEKETEERAQLVDFIFTNRKYQPESVAPERARLNNPRLTNIETLRTIRKNIELKRILESKSEEELKNLAQAEFVAQQTKAGIRTDRWLPVPALYRSRSMLISLANENISEYKRLLERCGSDQLNAILAQQDGE